MKLSTLSMLAAVVAGHSARPVPINPDSWFSANDYPPGAIASGDEGTVIYQVDVDPAGAVTACRVTRSSGQALLDRTTCDIVVARSHFEPATDSHGTPVAGSYTSSVTWAAPGRGLLVYQATVIDLTNPDHPVCTQEGTTGLIVPDISCAAFAERAAGIRRMGTLFRRLTYVYANWPVDSPPLRAPPEWGNRVSLLESDQFYLKGTHPFACVTMAAEGWNAGHDPCQGFPGERVVTDDERKSARISRNVQSIYAVNR